MARSSGNPSHSHQQPASPQHVATAAPEPKPVAGPEAVSREISVFQTEAKHAEWWDGRVTDFNSDSGQHLVRYHGREHRTQQWLQLSDQPFQWKSTPPATAAFNPTVKGIHLNDSIIGRKVKLFWPAMSKWYLGHIKEYDSKSGRHTVKYKDGEVKDYALRHEAVWWLDSVPDAKFTASLNRSKGLSNGSQSGNQDAHKQPAHSTGRTAAANTDSPKHRQKHSAAAEVSHPTVSVKTSPVNAEAAKAGGGSPKRRQKTAADASSPETGTHSSLSSTGNRSADDREDGSVSQSSCSRGPAETAFADMQDEEDQTQGAGSRHPPNPAAKPSRLATLRQGRFQDWSQLAGESKPGRKPITPTDAEAPDILEDADAGECSVGARVGIFWADDAIFYKMAPQVALYCSSSRCSSCRMQGQLSGYDAYHKRSKVCYDDGQEEWVSLMRETFRWYTPRGRTSKHFNPRMRDAMLELGAKDLASQPPQPPNPLGPTQAFVPDQQPGLSDSKAQSDATSSASAGVMAAAIPAKDAAVGWCVSIYSHAEGKFVKGQIIAHGKRQRHHVLFEDGEDEWLKLAEEHVQWHSKKCSIAQTAGLQQGTRTPKGLSAVGWRIGVYWTMDQKFYYGKVVHYDKDEETQCRYSIKYDDDEEEDVDLMEQPMKWVLPPNVSAASNASEEPALRSRRKQDSTYQESTKPRAPPVARRPSNGREVKRQKSRLGINRISCGIRKESSSTPKTTVPLPTLPLTSAIMLNTAGLHSDSFSPVATAGAPATAVGSAPTFMPMLLNATSTDSKNAAAAAVAQRLPSLLHVGSNSIPQLDRIIGPGCRRAPHLAGTRVKIFCSQTNRLVKSSRSLTSSSKQDVDVRRVRRRLEAVNQMIWRCECADTAITKGAPVPPSALNAADAEKHLLPANPATTAARVASHLGIASSAQLQQHSRSCSPGLMPASEQLPAYSVPGAQLLHNQQPPEAAVASQLEQPAAPQPDDAVLIHQLPSTAPMLLDDNSAMLMLVDPSAADTGSVPCTSERRHGQGTHTGTDCDTLLNIDAVQHAIPHSRHPSPNLGPIPLSRSPSGSLLGLTASRPASPSRNLSPSGSLLGLGTSRQASPSSASLAELVPSTTAVTVPPYNVISAAKAGIALTAPVVAVDAPMPTSEAQDCWSGKNATLAVRVGLRGETSFGVPETPDHEKFVLNRERSSLSKDQAEALASAGYMHSDVSMDRKSDLLASGMMGLATSDALPGEIEPAMIELFLGQ